MRNSALLLLLVAAPAVAFAQQKDPLAFRCETLIRTLPISQHPQVRQAYTRPDANLGDVVEQIDGLAAMDNADAQFAIGRMQQHGICAQQNTAGAIAYLTRAAENGSRDAQEALAAGYYGGRNASPANKLDIAPDLVKAYAWSRVAGDEQAVNQIRRKMTTAQIGEAETLSVDLLRTVAERTRKLKQ